LVTFSGLPFPPIGKVYEMWLITPGGRAVPAGVFTPDANGNAVVVVDQSLDGYKLMAVTVEGRPGVDQPTQQPQIYGTVA
jgi:anti-sigma-K factor RskA